MYFDCLTKFEHLLTLFQDLIFWQLCITYLTLKMMLDSLFDSKCLTKFGQSQAVHLRFGPRLPDPVVVVGVLVLGPVDCLVVGVLVHSWLGETCH